MENSEKLTGGNSNQVVRQGKTVIRQCGKWSPFVQQLLLFLAEQDFYHAPQLLARDGELKH